MTFWSTNHTTILSVINEKIFIIFILFVMQINHSKKLKFKKKIVSNNFFLTLSGNLFFFVFFWNTLRSQSHNNKHIKIKRNKIATSLRHPNGEIITSDTTQQMMKSWNGMKKWEKSFLFSNWPLNYYFVVTSVCNQFFLLNKTSIEIF